MNDEIIFRRHAAMRRSRKKTYRCIVASLNRFCFHIFPKGALLAPILFLSSSYVLLTDYCFVHTPKHLFLEGEYRGASKARFRTHSVKGSHQKYADGFAALYYSHALNTTNFLSVEVGDSYLKFDWPRNPRFTHSKYNIAVGSLGWVSTSIDRWRWILSGTATVSAHDMNFGRNGVYYGLMWGRYAFSHTTGIHLGFHGHYGMRNGYLLPLIGFDTHFWQKWQLNLIFPVDFSLTYTLSNNWSASVKGVTFGRPYRHPWRVQGGIGRYKEGIFEVYASGAELDLNFKLHSFNAGAGLGYNFGGWILIKDRHNNHPKYYKYDDAYFGRLFATLNF